MTGFVAKKFKTHSTRFSIGKVHICTNVSGEDRFVCRPNSELPRRGGFISWHFDTTCKRCQKWEEKNA